MYIATLRKIPLTNELVLESEFEELSWFAWPGSLVFVGGPTH